MYLVVINLPPVPVLNILLCFKYIFRNISLNSFVRNRIYLVEEQQTQCGVWQ